MDVIRVLKQRDTIITDKYLSSIYREHTDIKDIDTLISLYNTCNKHILDKLILDTNTKVILWRTNNRRIKFNKHDICQLYRYVNEDEMLTILQNNRLYCYRRLLYSIKDKNWNRVIKYISNNINNNSMNVNINIHDMDVNEDVNLLYHINEYSRRIIYVPPCHNVRDYKIMIHNWKKYNYRYTYINSFDKHNCKYIHHLLFNIILDDRILMRRWLVFHDYVLNIPILDYLAHEYPDSILLLYNFGPKKSKRLSNICIRYFPAYLDSNIVSDNWKKYYRMHINRYEQLSDICMKCHS